MGSPFKTPRYEGKVIADVEYRKPAELEAMRKLADALAPDVTGFKYASVPATSWCRWTRRSR